MHDPLPPEPVVEHTVIVVISGGDLEIAQGIFRQTAPPGDNWIAPRPW